MSKEQELKNVIKQGQKEALELAIKNNNLEQLKTLVEVLKIDLNAKDKDGDTLLHKAILSKDEALVKLLLEAGANPDIQNKWEQTPLHLIMLESNP